MQDDHQSNAAIKVLPATMEFPELWFNIVSITSVHGLGGDV